MQVQTRKPLRMWPGVLAAALLCLAEFVVPVVAPAASVFAMIGGLACTLAILVWWLFFSRAPLPDRVLAIVLIGTALFATSLLVHASIRGGMMGMMLPIYGLRALSLALVAWAVVSRRLSNVPRRATMVATILLACAVFTLLRTDGVKGAGSEFAWRWTPTPEERLLAQTRSNPMPLLAARIEPAPPPKVPPAPKA